VGAGEADGGGQPPASCPSPPASKTKEATRPNPSQHTVPSTPDGPMNECLFLRSASLITTLELGLSLHTANVPYDLRAKFQAQGRYWSSPFIGTKYWKIVGMFRERSLGLLTVLIAIVSYNYFKSQSIIHHSCEYW